MPIQSTPLQQALEKILRNINKTTGVGHPSDMLHTSNWLGEAISKMDNPDHPDDVGGFLISVGRLEERHARDIQAYYEALWCFIKGRTPFA